MVDLVLCLVQSDVVRAVSGRHAEQRISGAARHSISNWYWDGLHGAVPSVLLNHQMGCMHA